MCDSFQFLASPRKWTVIPFSKKRHKADDWAICMFTPIQIQFNMFQFSRNIDQIAFTLACGLLMPLVCFDATSDRNHYLSTFNMIHTYIICMICIDMCSIYTCVCVCCFCPWFFKYMHFGLIFRHKIHLSLRHIRPTYCAAWRTCHTLLRS